MKEKKKIVLSDYQEETHKIGKIWFIGVYICIIAFPLITCIYFDAWPNPMELLTACIGVVPTFWTVGVVEAFTYMPMLGAGGSYLGFITGNMSNLKVPVAIQAMSQAEVKQGSEEGDCISTIAIAVSSIVCTLIIVLFVILMAPLSTVFANEVLTPAFNNIVPALFGGLMVAYIVKDPKVGAPIISIGAIAFIAVPKLASIYPLILPILVLMAIGLARLLYKKGEI